MAKQAKKSTRKCAPAQASKTGNKSSKSKRVSVPASKIARHMPSTKLGKTRKALPQGSKVSGIGTKKEKCKSLGTISGHGQRVVEIHGSGGELTPKIGRRKERKCPHDSDNHIIDSSQNGLDESSCCIWEVISPSSIEQPSSKDKPRKELHAHREIMKQVKKATANKKKKGASVRKKQCLLAVKKKRKQKHLKKDVLPDGNGLQDSLDQSHECVWEMITSSSEQESTQPSPLMAECQNSVLETSNEPRKTSIHDSPSFTVVELGSDFGSGPSVTVSLTTADNSSSKKKKSADAALRQDSQISARNLFCLPQDVVSQDKFRRPTNEEQLLQSVVVVDLGNRFRSRSRDCGKGSDATSGKIKFRDGSSEERSLEASVQNLDLSHDFRDHGHDVQREGNSSKEFRSSTPKAKTSKRKRIKISSEENVLKFNKMQDLGEEKLGDDQSRGGNKSAANEYDEQEMYRRSTPKLKSDKKKRLKVSSEKDVEHSQDTRHLNLEDLCNDPICHKKESKRTEKDVPVNISDTSPSKKSGKRKRSSNVTEDMRQINETEHLDTEELHDDQNHHGSKTKEKHRTKKIKSVVPEAKRGTRSNQNASRSAKPVNTHDDVALNKKDTNISSPVQHTAKQRVKNKHKVSELNKNNQSLQMQITVEAFESGEQEEDSLSREGRQNGLILRDLESDQFKEKSGGKNDKNLQEISENQPDVTPSELSRGSAVEGSNDSPCLFDRNDASEAQSETSPMDVTANEETQESIVSDRRATSEVSFRILKLSKSDQCLILLQHPSKFSFRGKVTLSCIHGCITVNGFTVSAGDEHKSYPIYSSSSSCAVSIETSVECSSSLREPVSHGRMLTENVVAFLSKVEELEVAESLKGLEDRFAVALVVQEIPSDRAVEYVESFPGFGSLFSSPASKKLSDTDDTLSSSLEAAATMGFHPIMPSTSGAVFNMLPGYHDVTMAVRRWLNTSDVKPVVVVCGWKNTGKSTLCRYLTNSLLANTDGVCYLECDMAQTEFTPPGILSLQHVTKPLLGPPFTHIRKSERMCFYGDITVRGDPNSYLQMVRYLFQHYQSRYADMPLIINTMGWMQGIGLQLLIDIIHITRPTHIVQLWSPVQPRLTLKLTTESLEQTGGWWHRPDEGNDGARTFCPEILEVNVPNAGDYGGGKYKASDHRTMALLSYLSDLQPTPLPDPPAALSSLTPLVLPWRCVAVHVTNGHVSPRQVMYALNGSVVGLCQVNPVEMKFLAEDLPRVFDTAPVCRCLGLGIIRGIDPVQKVFYILTGVCHEALQDVNALLKGSITLPQSLLTQGHRTKDVPYVSQEFSSIVVGSSAIKVRRNIKQRGR